MSHIEQLQDLSRSSYVFVEKLKKRGVSPEMLEACFANPSFCKKAERIIDARLPSIRFRAPTAKNERIAPMMQAYYGLDRKKMSLRQIGQEYAVSAPMVKHVLDHAKRIMFDNDTTDLLANAIKASQMQP